MNIRIISLSRQVLRSAIFVVEETAVKSEKIVLLGKIWHHTVLLLVRMTS